MKNVGTLEISVRVKIVGVGGRLRLRLLSFIATLLKIKLEPKVEIDE